jgi:hypothetical protein
MLGFGSIKPGDQPGVSRNEFNARMSWMQTELKNFAQEVTFLKAQRGPPGPRGPPGEDGRDGSPGHDGRDGVNGQPGLDGRAGASGEGGKSGPPGPRGEPGYSAGGGWTMQILKSPYSMNDVPTMATLTYVGSTNVKFVNLGNDAAFRDAFPALPDRDYVWRFYGTLRVRETGQYTLCTTVDNGARLFVDDKLLLRNYWLNRRKCGAVTLRPGFHRIAIDGWQNIGAARMQLDYAGPDTEGEPVDVPSIDSTAPPPPPPSRWTLRTYQSAERLSVIPELKDVALVGEATVPAVNFEDLQDFRAAISATGGSDIAWQAVGKVSVYRPGKYSFCSTSRDGSKLWVDGAEVVDNDGEHTVKKVCGEVALVPGLHDVEVRGFCTDGDPRQIAQYKGPDTGEELELIDSVDPMAPPPPAPSQFLLRVYGTGALTVTPATFGEMRMVGEAVVPELEFSGRGAGDFGKFVDRTPSTNFAYEAFGRFSIGAGGNYKFCVTSIDGSVLQIDGQDLVNNDGLHASRKRCGDMLVRPGIHLIKVRGFHSASAQGDMTALSVTYSGRDTENANRPLQSLSADPF